MSESIDRAFNYHRPDEQAVKDHQMVRDECKDLAELFDSLPAGREKALAMTKLEEAMFWANAAIARDGK